MCLLHALMQVADAPALGCAILAAVAAGLHPDVATACAHMVHQVREGAAAAQGCGVCCVNLSLRLQPEFALQEGRCGTILTNPSGPAVRCAVLCCALCCAVLCAVLCCAVLCCALCCAACCCC